MSMNPRLKILAVDDDPSVRRLLGQFLGQQYEVTFAVDAIGAVSAARRERPDLVLLDFSLPAGNGSVVVERLRLMPDLAATPIVIISGWESPWSWDGLLDMDVAGFLPKPFTRDELLDELARALGIERVTA